MANRTHALHFKLMRAASFDSEHEQITASITDFEVHVQGSTIVSLEANDLAEPNTAKLFTKDSSTLAFSVRVVDGTPLLSLYNDERRSRWHRIFRITTNIRDSIWHACDDRLFERLISSVEHAPYTIMYDSENMHALKTYDGSPTVSYALFDVSKTAQDPRWCRLVFKVEHSILEEQPVAMQGHALARVAAADDGWRVKPSLLAKRRPAFIRCTKSDLCSRADRHSGKCNTALRRRFDDFPADDFW